MPGWQSFTELRTDEEFVFIAIAFDTGGVPDAKPLYDGAKATYVTLVDPQNAFGQALNLKVVPNGLFFDEAGKMVYRKEGGFEVRSQGTMDEVEKFLAAPKATGPRLEVLSDSDVAKKVEADPENGSLRLDLGQRYTAAKRYKDARPHLEAAVRLLPKSSAPLAAMASLEMELKNKAKAVELLDQALKLDSTNYVIRKQRWLILYPEKFHPTIDWAWQREQMRKEIEGGSSQPKPE